MKLKKWLTGVLAAAMALSLAACSDGGAESADAGSEDSITLGFAQVGSESEWRTANTDNIKAAAEAAGVTLQFSDAQQKQENQIKAIRSFIASDVDVISFCPIVETGWDTVLQEAKDAGIPVVLVDRGVTADPSLYVTHIFADALKEGANAFNWVDEYMTAEGKTPRAGGDQFQVAILGARSAPPWPPTACRDSPMPWPNPPTAASTTSSVPRPVSTPVPRAWRSWSPS